jgi:hypothetical protein
MRNLYTDQENKMVVSGVVKEDTSYMRGWYIATMNTGNHLYQDGVIRTGVSSGELTVNGGAWWKSKKDALDFLKEWRTQFTSSVKDVATNGYKSTDEPLGELNAGSW